MTWIAWRAEYGAGARAAQLGLDPVMAMASTQRPTTPTQTRGRGGARTDGHTQKSLHLDTSLRSAIALVVAGAVHTNRGSAPIHPHERPETLLSWGGRLIGIARACLETTSREARLRWLQS